MSPATFSTRELTPLVNTVKTVGVMGKPFIHHRWNFG